MELRVAINGFGRIGRCLTRILHEREVEILAINDLADIGDLAYLLKYDSTHGWWSEMVDSDEDAIHIGERHIPFLSIAEPSELPWEELGVDIVFECSGAHRGANSAAGHLEAGASRVIISAPSGDADGMFVLGVNSDDYDPAEHEVVSMASCTTGSLAPVAKVLDEVFGIETLAFTTVHAYTTSQALLDVPKRKRRRGRAAATSIIPTTTGAAAATVEVLPQLAGKLDGMALRVPVPDGSVTDITATLSRATTPNRIHEALERAAIGPMRDILRVSHEELVSRDILGDPHSAIVDAPCTRVMGDNLARLLVWYDNEWGYAARLADFAELIFERGI